MGKKCHIWLALIKSDNSTPWICQIHGERYFQAFLKSSLTKENVSIASLIRARPLFQLSPTLNLSLCF